MHQKPSDGWALPGHTGELKRSPRPPSRIRVLGAQGRRGMETGRLNARVMETAGNAHFMGVWNAQVMEAACKLSCTETAGN